MERANDRCDKLRRIAGRACWPMIRGYSARDLGPGSAAPEPSSGEPKAVPRSVTDAPGGSRLSRYGAGRTRRAATAHRNGPDVPNRRRRWSGASAHHSGTAGTRCQLSTARLQCRCNVRAPMVALPQGRSGGSAISFPAMPPVRLPPSRARHALAALAGCLVRSSRPPARSAAFDPSGPCTEDGRAAGAYPDLEALVPRSLDGRPARTQSTPAATARRRRSDARGPRRKELQFAGATWSSGPDARRRRSRSSRGAEARRRTGSHEFFETGARDREDHRNGRRVEAGRERPRRPPGSTRSTASPTRR